MKSRLIVAFLIALFTAGPSMATDGIDRGSYRDDVGIGAGFYDFLSSVHMKADLLIERSGVTTTGSFEYWADGDKYRVSCATNGAPDLMADVQYAYDGSRFQFFYSDAGTLTSKAGDIDALPTAVPNPFFWPIDYLTPDQATCPGCALKLRHLRGEARAFRSKIDAPGETLRTLPRTIQWLRKDGTVSSTISLGSGDDVFPHRITLTDFNDSGQKIAEVQAVIRELTVNEGVDSAVFVLPAEQASSVWNLDIPDLRSARVK